MGFSAPFTLICSYFTSNVHIRDTLDQKFGYKHLEDEKTFTSNSLLFVFGVLFVIRLLGVVGGGRRLCGREEARFDPGRASHGVAPRFHDVSAQGFGSFPRALFPTPIHELTR